MRTESKSALLISSSARELSSGALPLSSFCRSHRSPTPCLQQRMWPSTLETRSWASWERWTSCKPPQSIAAFPSPGHRGCSGLSTTMKSACVKDHSDWKWTHGSSSRRTQHRHAYLRRGCWTASEWSWSPPRFYLSIRWCSLVQTRRNHSYSTSPGKGIAHHAQEIDSRRRACSRSQICQFRLRSETRTAQVGLKCVFVFQLQHLQRRSGLLRLLPFQDFNSLNYS